MVKVAHIKRRYVSVNEKGYRIGQDHQRAKLSDEDIELIFELVESGMSYAKIAAKMDHVPGGVGKTTIADIVQGTTRSQLIWRRVKR